MRDYENTLLDTYKQFLTILEALSKIKPGQLVSKLKLDSGIRKDNLYSVYTKLRSISISTQC